MMHPVHSYTQGIPQSLIYISKTPNKAALRNSTNITQTRKTKFQHINMWQDKTFEIICLCYYIKNLFVLEDFQSIIMG